MGNKVVISNAKIVRDTVTGETFVQCGCGDNLVPIGGGGTGGVSSFNDLPDKPFGTESTRFIGFENKTVKITEEVNENGYSYYSAYIDGDLGELGSTTGAGMDDTHQWNFEIGSRCVIVVDGVEYESDIMDFAGYLFFGKYQLAPCGVGVYTEDCDAPIGIAATENGFTIGMTSEYVGTHEISLYVYDDVDIPLHEKYIPETIKRVNNAVELFEIDIQDGQEYKIPAGSTFATLTPFFNFGVDSLSKATNNFVYVAVGDYIIQDQDVESGKWTAKSVQLDCSIDKTIYYDSYNNRYMGTGVVNITIPEPLDYDVNIALYSNPQIIVYAGKGGSM